MTELEEAIETAWKDHMSGCSMLDVNTMIPVLAKAVKAHLMSDENMDKAAEKMSVGDKSNSGVPWPVFLCRKDVEQSLKSVLED